MSLQWITRPQCHFIRFPTYSYFFFFFFFFHEFLWDSTLSLMISPDCLNTLRIYFHANRSLVQWALRMPVWMNILLVMTKREEPCIGFLKMLNKSKSLHCRYPEEPNHTLDKCPYNGRLIQKLWNEQQNKKKDPPWRNCPSGYTTSKGQLIGVDAKWLHHVDICMTSFRRRVPDSAKRNSL